jgi:hypothetical protein
MVCERQATRTYTESEALDLSVRNLTSEWRPEIRRLVERDKRTGHDGALPFKLSLAQLATTFVEYASEIVRNPPSSQSTSSNRTPTSIIRRIEAAPLDISLPSETILLDDADIDLMVRAISQSQVASSVCLGCHHPGHKLEDCIRFVDYIVAEGLAQRHPQLKAQIANSHKQFRTRLISANARSRPPSGPSNIRTMRRILENEPVRANDAIADDDDDDDDVTGIVGHQQNSIRTTADDETDFEACFQDPTINSITVTVAAEAPALPASETIHLGVASDPILLRRLAETYDRARQLSFAHADNGSMACTANDRQLLFAYRPLHHTNVRLFDAGHHAHHPIGVGFLCVPIDVRGHAGGPSSVFIRTYYTPTIPGIIISHAAISKQLGTDGYHMSSFTNGVGHIHFPHRLRRSQDIYIILQPTANRGGLTFTEALIAPTAEAHLAPLPSNQLLVRRLCTEHAPVTAATILNPIDGMTCGACHSPPDPGFSVGPLPRSHPTATLKCNNLHQVTAYVRKKYDLLERHNVFRRIDRLLLLGDRHSFAERLDKDVVEASLAAEKSLRKYGEPQWSVELHHERKKVQILKKCLSMAKTRLDNAQTIRQEWRKIYGNTDPPGNERECLQHLRQSETRVKELVNASFDQREHERLKRIQELSKSNKESDKSRAKMLRQLQVAEAKNRLYAEDSGDEDC